MQRFIGEYLLTHCPLEMCTIYCVFELNLCHQGLNNFCLQHAREEKRRKDIERKKQLEEERRKKQEKERRELMRQKQKEKEEKKKDESATASFRVSHLEGFFQMHLPFRYCGNPLSHSGLPYNYNYYY